MFTASDMRDILYIFAVYIIPAWAILIFVFMLLYAALKNNMYLFRALFHLFIGGVILVLLVRAVS